MSEQVPTKQVSLDDLKRAVAAVSDLPRLHPPVDQLSDLRNERVRAAYEHARAGGWRTAFEWLNQIAASEGFDAIEEYHDGMRLIREKLR